MSEWSAGPALLSADAVSRLLDVDTSTVYRMAGDGRLPAVKVGRQWRFPADRIARLLDVEPLPRLDAALAQPVIDVAADLLGVMMVVTDMDGRPLTTIANPCPRLRARAIDSDALAQCCAEWRSLAHDPDFAPRFQVGALGFECARALVRNGVHLVGLVVAGGVAPMTEPPSRPSDGCYVLSEEKRRLVLTTLPKVAARLFRTTTQAREPRLSSSSTPLQGVAP
jgi:excisionase family DNA binding protein